MTPEEFQALYHPVEALTHRGVRSYRARPATGGEVFLHVFADVPDDDRERLLDLIERLPDGERRKVLSTVQVAEQTVVVSEVLDEFEDLDAWLTSRATPAPDPEPDPGVLSEFSSLFGVPPPQDGGEDGDANHGSAGRAAVPSPPSTGSTPAPPSPPPATPGGGSEPGEFTRLFGASEAGKDPEAPGPAPNPPVAAPSEPPAPSPPPRSSPPVAPTSPPSRGSTPAPPSPPPAPPGGGSEPGEFTRLFGASDAPPSPTAPTPPAPQPGPPPPTREVHPDSSGSPEAGEFTRLFGASGPAADAPASPKGSPPGQDRTASEQGATPEAGGPGEFTRLFGTPAQPTTGSSPGRSSAAPGTGSEAWEERLRGSGGPGQPPSKGSREYRERLMGDPPPAPPPGPAPVQPDLPTGPGAYTRIVSATPASPEAPGAAPVSEAPAPEPKRGRQNSDWIVLAAILAVVLIGAALLVFFVLRTAEGEPPTP